MDKRMFTKKLALSRGNLHKLVWVGLLCVCVSAGNAVEPTTVAESSESSTGSVEQQEIVNNMESFLPDEESDDVGTHEYEYQVAARPDPFKPFIAPKRVNPNELVDENLELTGMQLFEPGQLNLVAVMDTPRGRIAMVEDYTKKGYKITQGQLIGRRGQVTEIRKDEVLVTETAYTRGGEEIKTVVSMKMKRDGDGK